jgi:hypothetical protein
LDGWKSESDLKKFDESSVEGNFAVADMPGVAPLASPMTV